MVQVQTDKQCSQCGAINKFEIAYERTKQTIFCTACRHKRILATITSTTTKTETITLPPIETADKF